MRNSLPSSDNMQCPTGKLIYSDPEKANKHLKKLRRDGGKTSKIYSYVTVYTCPVCRRWHIGSSVQNGSDGGKSKDWNSGRRSRKSDWKDDWGDWDG